MKAVFPSKGVVIVTKYNVNVLRDYYRNNLINSKLFAIYEQSNYFMQAGNFNYFPKKSNLILYKSNLLTLKKLQEVIANQINQTPELAEKITAQKQETTQEFSNEPLDDNFVKNNPFFNTLTSTED